MKNKLMFIGLSVMAAGSVMPLAPKLYTHNLTGKALAAFLGATTKSLVITSQPNKALVPLFTPLFGRYSQAQAKLAQAAAGSTNSDVIFGSMPKSKSYWKSAFFGLFAGATTVGAVKSMSSTDVVNQVTPEIFTPVVEESTPVVNNILDTTIADNVLSTVSRPTPVTLSFSDKAKACAVLAGTKVANGASFLKTNTWDKNLGYFKHDGKVATSAAVLATAGLTYATYKAYKNGSFSKLNPFGKAVVAQVEEAQVVEEAPVVMHKRALNKTKTWNTKTRTYQVAK
ncbi:MAG: hypothetical protein NTZ68_01255 [Candidatus Dependentiae bacterium]|nr:hypothetical protein [Candidatus Dependentiae bacterium]